MSPRKSKGGAMIRPSEAGMTGACKVCGYDVRPGVEFCRQCDAAAKRAMRKAQQWKLVKVSP